MDNGFKYLGFYLKPNSYRVKYWFWLLKKIEKRITIWSYRFLSLGGRINLINATLQSILVYWCSLLKLPTSIINVIRANIFHLLFEGSHLERKFYLVSWEILATPTHLGGWVFRTCPYLTQLSV